MGELWQALRRLAVPRRALDTTRASVLGRWQCRGKTRYTSRNAALNAATTIANHSGDRRMRPYICHRCHYWHLSHVGRTI